MDRWEIFLFQNLLLRCKSTQLLLLYQEKSQTIGKAEFAAQKAAVQLSEVSTSGTHRCLRLKFGNLSVLSDIKQLLIKVSNKIQGQQSCLTDNICYSFSRTLKSSLAGKSTFFFHFFTVTCPNIVATNVINMEGFSL